MDLKGVLMGADAELISRVKYVDSLFYLLLPLLY